MSCQKIFLNILQNSHKKVYARVSFLIKSQARNLKTWESPLQMFLKESMFLKRGLVFQNQPFIDTLQNRCSWITDKIHRKKLVLESLFNKVVVVRTSNFIKEGRNAGVFLWNLQIFLKTIILKNICERLLQNFI